VDPSGLRLDFRFDVPPVQPGSYAFVLFSAFRGRRRGFLIDDTRPGQLLRVLPSTAPSDTGDGAGATWWIVGGIGAIGLAISGVLLFRRRRTA
jgi:LPXTG-motif cell wall-anchored protein